MCAFTWLRPFLTTSLGPSRSKLYSIVKWSKNTKQIGFPPKVYCWRLQVHNMQHVAWEVAHVPCAFYCFAFASQLMWLQIVDRLFRYHSMHMFLKVALYAQSLLPTRLLHWCHWWYMSPRNWKFGGGFEANAIDSSRQPVPRHCGIVISRILATGIMKTAFLSQLWEGVKVNILDSQVWIAFLMLNWCFATQIISNINSLMLYGL